MTEKHRNSERLESDRGEAANDPFALPEGLPVPDDDGADDLVLSLLGPLQQQF